MGIFRRAGSKKSGGKKRFGFTLTELLVVVIVLGVLAAVAAPKFTRVLETRKTTEAEDLLASVRAEQEHRCLVGRNYTKSWGQLPVSANATQSANYAFALNETGAVASSKSKNYSLQVPSYQDGRICCDGEYCQKLNKDYPLCSALPAVTDDMCAARGGDYCTENPDDCSCNSNQAKCCLAGTVWDGSSCVPDTSGTCQNAAYAAAHPCECAPNTCACPTYGAAYPCECDEAAKNSCQCNPKQEVCCKDNEMWDGQKCAPKTDTCQDPVYAAANPCECAPNSCQCPTYAAAYPCECAPSSCQCASYAAAYPCECAPNSCACPTYAAGYPEQCGGAWQWVVQADGELVGKAPGNMVSCSSLAGGSCQAGDAARTCFTAGKEVGGWYNYRNEETDGFVCSGSPDITSVPNGCRMDGGPCYYYYQHDMQEGFGYTWGHHYLNEYCGSTNEANGETGCLRQDITCQCPSGEKGDAWDFLGNHSQSEGQALCEANCPSGEACKKKLYYCLPLTERITGQSQTGWSYINGEDERLYRGFEVNCQRDVFAGKTHQAVCRQVK